MKEFQDKIKESFPKKKRKQFEYCIKEINKGKMDFYLDDMGLDGWELCDTISIDNGAIIKFFFKREII